ncbi:sensor domain-containing protein [Bhargavaea cecembensis]|uniref:sensor domain-containing protein n=1 Tax=Bhargavaea cecembensis TaxID=394098 RepID=UPI0006938960|nr:sensor domain-containing diguanylate cyclase [Bhargavaea cecembensis]
MGNANGSLPERVLMDGIGEMVFVMAVGSTGAFIYEFVNRAARNILGLGEDIIGREICEVVGEERGKDLEDRYREVALSGVPAVYEDSYPGPSGQECFSEVRLTPLIGGEACTHIVATVRDVTEKVLAMRSESAMSSRLEESGSRYRALYENNSDGVLDISDEGLVLAANPAAVRLIGKREEELVGMHYSRLVAAGDEDRAREAFRRAGVESGDIRLDVRTGEGPVGCLLKFTPVMTSGRRIGCYAHLKDMRELDRLVGQFVESERRFRIIAENVRDVITLMDADWHFLYVSPSSLMMFGFSPEQLMQTKADTHIHPADFPELNHVYESAIREREAFMARVRLLHAQDGWLWSEITGSAVYESDGSFLQMVLVIRDVTRQKEEEDRLQQFAYHDALTGLPNRRLFLERLGKRLDEYRLTGSSFAVVLMDIDDFKRVNDNLGHAAGDEVIRAFGERIAVALEDGLVARLGGDEFVVLTDKCRDAEEAAAFGRTILASLADPLHVPGWEIRITTSLGIALAAPDRQTPGQLLKLADQAMYEAKKSGRNRFRIL